MNWWAVKVYDKGSNTTTTLSIHARDEEHIREQLAEDGYWEFVRAVPEE